MGYAFLGGGGGVCREWVERDMAKMVGECQESL